MSSDSTDCVALFSGGRDSTVAALRLVQNFPSLKLVTVTTEHLVNLGSVIQRLKELGDVLPKTVSWIHAVARPNALVTIGQENIESCLPCHHTYLKTAMAIAKSFGARNIALGYASYQDTWLEQTPYAVDALRDVLTEFGMNLLLPSANLSSKIEAAEILKNYGLTDSAMEQKCLQQQFNTRDLSPTAATSEIDSWKIALRKSFHAGMLSDVDISTPLFLREVTAAYAN